MRLAFAILCCAIALTACSGPREPAQRMVLDIDATLIAASAESAKYVPEQLAELQHRYDGLKLSFDQQDYTSVMRTGPAVLVAAQTLATAAALKKDQVLKDLNDDWTGLADVVPDEVAVIRSRIDRLSMQTNKKVVAGVDLNAAKATLSDAMSLWSKATAAFAAGNLEEAVSSAKAVKAKLDPIAVALRVNTAPPALAPAAA